MTPMMAQYFEVKNQYKDYLLFYRVGDFYEMFYDDAILASRVLELTLTGRDAGEEERAPMCGVPFHAADVYIGRLIEKGYRVAICEQTENPKEAQGLVRREVIRVVTPGTLIETELLPETKNNYICSIYVGENSTGICFADISTAEVYTTCFENVGMESRLKNELGTYSPCETLLNVNTEKISWFSDYVRDRMKTMVIDNQPHRFEAENVRRLVCQQFGEETLNELLHDFSLVAATGALLDYISEMQKCDISYIKNLNVYRDGQYMELDINTRRNLELTEAMRSKDKKGSLLWVLDKTRTAPGARMLRKWIEHPLLNVKDIVKRQGAVGELCENFMLREEIGELLSHVLDLERLITKVVYGTSNARDLRAIAATVSVLPELRDLLGACQSDALSEIFRRLDVLSDVHALIDAAIVKDPPIVLREGGLIADGYNEDIDRLRSIMNNGKDWIEKIAEQEREATGIKNLKISYNKVFGYYIEVTKSYYELVPDRYIRKQTLANCERYITQELKDMEATILGAEDKVRTLEYEVFQQIRTKVAENSDRIRSAAEMVSLVDVYLSLATVASRNKYTCPEVDIGSVITIKDGRHPVVEQFVKDSYFVPNDVLLDTDRNRLMLITGPNMAGKSTYMRQVALIVIMAQIGSFVPAEDARIGIVDKVFTRVGASDDLASGQSTFMLEMNEVAYILKNATKRSLIIYDEVGRGTSTFDGMSIARAIVEYTSGKKLGAKTLFATHYHELTSLEDEFDGIVNYNIAAKKRGDSITFLRKIVRGSTDDSYGIEVAKLAGIPNEVIKRAKEILSVVERSASNLVLTDREAKPDENDNQISMEECIEDQILNELKATDINTMSPLEALTFLFDIKKRLG